ncbi:MAG: hydantoinase/oxoprolinase family protein [Pseudomonadota bacterium]
MSCRIGIDVGGTFTDFVLIDEAAARTVTYKEPSTPEDPAASVVGGLPGLLAAADRGIGDVGLIVHGTTLALNAILQRKLAKVGLVVSQGFGDIMILGRGGLPNSFSYKDPKREPLVARHHVYEVPARLRPNGTRVAEPTEADLDAIAERIRHDGLEALAVLVINAYAHPAIELDLAAALEGRLPRVPVTASSALWPEVREYERALVTVLNAALQPMMAGYYRALQSRLEASGFTGRLAIASSNGGTVGVATAAERPIVTLLSGPAAGVSAAAQLSKDAGIGRLLTIDMGGTSSDMSIAVGGVAEVTNETRIGDHPVIVPAINVWAIGAGGGSIVWVDAQGLLKVGPESAGAAPGPVAYGRGGTRPTVTDCYLVLGFIDPEHFLGGRMPLSREAAAAALRTLGATIGFDGPDAAERTAEAALRIATARMATEVGKGMASRGFDPADFTLLAFGGAGPTHAAMVAEAARIPNVVIPASPGTYCAFGTAVSDMRRDFAQSRRVRIGRDEGAADTIVSAFADLRDEAAAWLGAEGLNAADAAVTHFADMQYPKTATELPVSVPAHLAKGSGDADLAELFHVEHERRYGFRDAASPVDVSTLRVVATVPAKVKSTGGHAAEQSTVSRRLLRWQGETLDAAVHAGVLAEGETVRGPAVIEMADSTVLVPPGWDVRGGERGLLRVSRQAVSETSKTIHEKQSA